jgi:hypothetical protein
MVPAMTCVMGIDGGGSTIRVVIVTPDLTILGQSEGPAVNPSVVKRELAAARIQAAMRDALAAAKLTPDQIAGGWDRWRGSESFGSVVERGHHACPGRVAFRSQRRL